MDPLPVANSATAASRCSSDNELPLSMKLLPVGCPLRARCTSSPQGRKIELHEHDALQREHRQRAVDPAFQNDYRTHRPMVERSIAWLTRGNRRVRHRGVSRNNVWLQLRIAGLNLRRLLTLGVTVNEGACEPTVRIRPIRSLDDAPHPGAQ
jgi:hypothetical protein